MVDRTSDEFESFISNLEKLLIALFSPINTLSLLNGFSNIRPSSNLFFI